MVSWQTALRLNLVRRTNSRQTHVRTFGFAPTDDPDAHPRIEQTQTSRASPNPLREGHSHLHFRMVRAASGLEQAKAAPGQSWTGDVVRFDYGYYSRSAAADE